MLLRLSLLSISVGIVLIGAELFVRATMPQRLGVWGVTREGLITLAPGLDVRVHYWHTELRTNRFGFRDLERQKKRPEESRILVIGDSFMEALQVPFSESFPQVLQEELGGYGISDVQVLNASVSGWGTEDALVALERYGPALEPDLVLLVMTLHNDVSDNLYLESYNFDGEHLTRRENSLMPTSKYIELSVKGAIAQNLHLYHLVRGTFSAKKVESAGRSLDEHVAKLVDTQAHTDVEQGWLVTFALLDRLRSEAARQDARLAVVLIPLRIQVQRASWARFAARHRLSPTLLDEQVPQRRVSVWANRNGVPVVNLLSPFQRWRDDELGLLYLEEDGHWTARGHALAADKVAEALRQEYLVPGPRAD